MNVFEIASEAELAELAQRYIQKWQVGDIVALEGPLGAGKTTFVRACLRACAYEGAVRSPTFNLIQTFPTTPPILHSDLYRVSSANGLGLEDEFAEHLTFIEWPDRMADLIPAHDCWWVQIEFGHSPDSRTVTVTPPVLSC